MSTLPRSTPSSRPTRPRSARATARWSWPRPGRDPAFRQALLKDATAAVGTLGHVSRVGDHLVAVENTPQRHNMIVCTLCSCYPWEMLGLPPVWYKSAPYRSRAVKDPRGVLADFGVKLPKETEIRVWDSTAETRFLVLPDASRRHRGVERGAAGRPRHPRFDDRHRTGARARRRSANERRPRHGRHGRLRQGRGRDGRAAVPRTPGRAACSACSAPWATPAPGTSTTAASRRRRCRRRSISPPRTTGAGRCGMEQNLVERGLVTGKSSTPAVRWRRPSRCRASSPPTWCGAGMTRSSFFRQQQAPARFKPGDRVRARNINPLGHTRLPRYARGKRRHGRADPRLPRLSRFGRGRPRRRSAMAVHGGVRRPRDLGPRLPIRR